MTEQDKQLNRERCDLVYNQRFNSWLVDVTIMLKSRGYKWNDQYPGLDNLKKTLFNGYGSTTKNKIMFCDMTIKRAPHLLSKID